MDSFRLPLFPEGSLSSSVITTVFVGVWVVSFFNLRLGWSFSGLVVPGYLAPLFLANPWAGAVVCAEGVVTYLIVWVLSERLGRGLLWCNFFGRDRFFALVLTSIGVRLAADVWLLPLAGEWVTTTFGFEFDYHNKLHSYGLIVVALLANQMWKPGLVAGLGTAAVTLGLTCLFVRYVLMVFTNFSVGNLQYMYEDIASSLLASPKSYIILVTTAYLASRMNLRYSWEFNGILVPALIAIQWFEPLKILMTVAEAVAIYALAGFLLRSPVLRGRSFEGAQKLLLFFTVGFAWKMALGYLLPHAWPGVRPTDYFGFGYLLSTLIALKAHDKGIVIRMASATFQISLVGAVAGSLIGFALTLMPRPWSAARPGEIPDEKGPPAHLSDAIGREKLARYGGVGQPETHPDAAQRAAFAGGLRDLLAYIRSRSPDLLRRGRGSLESCGYRVEEVEGRYLCVHEAPAGRGWGFYALALDCPDGVAVEVPACRGEWATAEAGLALFRQMRGRALALAGGRAPRAPAPRLPPARSLFQTFHEVVAVRNCVQVRAGDGRESSLWVKAALPEGLDLAGLRRMVGTIHIHWHPPGGDNAQSNTSSTAFAELFLSRPDRRAMLIGSTGPPPEKPRGAVDRASGRIRPWLLAARARVADAGTNLYVPPTQEELLLFDDEVLTPLLRTVAGWTGSDEDRLDLEAVAVAAGVFGYRVIWHTDPTGPTDFLILTEADPLPRRHWGTYVFRAGGGPFVIQTPRPIYELNTLEHGALLFERLQARAWLLHGAHPEANEGRTADAASPRNKRNLFNLTCQAVFREAGEEELLAVQCRAFGVRPAAPGADCDALLASGGGATSAAGLSRLSKQLLEALEADRLRVRLTDGSAETAGYEASTAPQLGYLAQARNKEMALVWLSPLSRPLYRQQADNRIQEAQFKAVDIPTFRGDLFERFVSRKGRGGSGRLPVALKEAVERYLAARDVVILYEMRARWPEVRFERLVDEATQRAFLLLEPTPGRAPVVANLAGQPTGAGGHETTRVGTTGFTAAEMSRYADSRTTWLELAEGGP